MLPGLDQLLNSETLFNFTSTQESALRYSQMSPPDNISLPSACTSRRSSIIGLDLPPSSHSIGSYQLPGDLGRYSSPFNKGIHEIDNIPDFIPFAENELDPICGVGLDFDGNGNLIGVCDEEPELPLHRGTSPDPLHTAGTTLPRMENIQAQGAADLVEEPFLDFGEAALPDAEPFAVHPASKGLNTDTPTLTTETTGGKGVVAYKAAPRRKVRLMLDRDIRVPRDEFRGWTENYEATMRAARKKAKITAQAQAKRNALAFLYSNGISGVGGFERDFGLRHPLAPDFAGTALEAQLLGVQIDDHQANNTRKSRRRKSPEAFGVEEDDNRNVRRRLEEDEFARGEAGPTFGGGLDFDNDTAPEIGLEAVAPLEDKLTSSFMPWSRQGSAAPGSATRAPGSARKSTAAPSPLHGRGSIIGSIERHSDPVEDPLGFVGFGSQASSINFEQDQAALDFGAENATPSTQGLDAYSQRFLGYVAEQAAEHGVLENDGLHKKHWIDFEDLANPELHSKAVASQAFLHVLSLATKNLIAVKQDGIADNEPFGTLRVGLTAQVLNLGTTIVE